MNKFILASLLVFPFLSRGQNCHFSGWIKAFETKEYIVDALVSENGSSNYQLTNSQGYFSLSTQADSISIVITAIGYEPLLITYTCRNKKDTVLFLVKDRAKQFEEFVVTAKRKQQLGVISMPVEELKRIPMLGGEPDIIRSLQLMPGVQGGKEGSSGLYVRGGTPDQNLFLLDDVHLYNVNHIGGFLSTFDPNTINSVQLYKGNFPARYSGRLSAVVDLRMKNGNQKKRMGEVQVGLLSTKLYLEGPLGKDSSWTYLVSGRRFNIDVFTRIISHIESGGESGAGYTFFDSNLKLVKRFKDNSTLSFGYFGGRDRIFVNAREKEKNPYRYKSNMKWGNFMGYMQYNKAINNKWFYSVNLATTHFFYTSGVHLKEELPTEVRESKLMFNSKITDVLLKQSITYKVNQYWTLVGGWNTTGHFYLPGKMTSSNINQDTIIGDKVISAWENNFYVENQLRIQDKFTANIGFNLSTFAVQKTTFTSPEPRILLNYTPYKKVSIQAGYAQMQQFVHFLTNSGAGLPSDIWIPATKDMLPEKSTQYNAGIILSDLFDKFPLDFTIEGFYKEFSNLIDYKEGSSLLAPQNLLSKVETNGIGKVYGIEFLVRRNIGKVTGWIGYTFSKNDRKFENMNNGNWYPFKFDRTHDISVVVNYKINEKIDLSATWVYMTGNAFTLTQGQYEYLAPIYNHSYDGYDPTNYTAHLYNGKNSVRLPSYHRLDVGVNLTKVKKKGTRIWSFSVYNLYNRQNAFFFYYRKNNDGLHSLHQLTIFPIIPSISYRFLF